MKIEPIFQNMEKSKDTAFINFLKKRVVDFDIVRINISMAYVTVAGAREIISIFKTGAIQHNWVIGIDDYVSHPSTFTLCGNLPDAQVKYGSAKKKGGRFHPKLIYGESSSNLGTFMIIGSNNITKLALNNNIEAGVSLTPETEEDKIFLDELWKKSWNVGEIVTQKVIEKYEVEFLKNKNKNKNTTTKIPARRNTTPPLKTDDVVIDPSVASVLWIECGKITANGRELEFKSGQHLFFGFDENSEGEKHIDFILSNGITKSLRVIYRGNDMWRLEMTVDVPEVSRGLRPRLSNGKLGRSRDVAVFERINDQSYKLFFVRENGSAHKNIMRKSLSVGALGSTSSRRYGWY